MAQSFALSSSPEFLRRARSTAPFWFSLLLSLWLVIDTAHDPQLGTTGLIPLLPAMVMIGLTVTLLVLRANDASACLLAVYMCTLAILARGNTAGIAPPWNLSSGHPALYEGGYHPIHIIWALALGGVPLYFGWIYTEQDRVERRTWLKHLLPLGLLLCSALGTLACLFIAMHRRYTPMPLDTITRTLPSPYHRILLFTAPMVLTQHAAAFWLLLRHHRQWGEPRHRALVLVFGFALLFVSCVIINDSVAHIATWVLANLTACLVPLMVVYSLEKHALFDIRIFLRRTVQYALARQALTLLSLAPLVVLAYLWGLTANGQPEGWDLLRRMTLRNETLVFGALSLVFATTLILRAPLLRHFDRAYFREIYDAQRMLNEVGRSLLGISDPREIGRATLEGIDAALHPINAMLLAEENGHVSCLAHRNYAGYRPPLWPDPALLSTDRVYSVPSSDGFYPLRRLSWADALPTPARALLTEARIRLVIPVREEDRTVGVLLLGEKASGMAYAPEDIEVLRALASQIALAMQSARLNREFLRRSTYELKAGSVGFVELVERERRLLAADLHDQTLPELRCLLTDLQSVADSGADLSWPTPAPSERSGAVPVRMTPEEMAEHLRQTIENIRDIMESLRPSALEVLGLMPALENELRKAASRARPPLVPQFQVLAGTQPDTLSSFAEMSIFRIVQEAVNNACRHSGAQTVRVQIDVEDSEWVLRIEDDGVGLAAPLAACMETADSEEESNRERPPAEVARRGRGLDNMQYRASLIGARLAWEVPDWGKGTRVELRLPLKT
jgi:signal transduction histidine kinase